MHHLRGIVLFFILGSGLTLLLAGVPGAGGQEKEKDPEAGAAQHPMRRQKDAPQAAGAETMTPEEAAVATGMRTRVYHLPGWVSYPRYEVKEGESVAREALKDQGIPFPKGAVAFYNEETEQLIVTNTLENLARLQQLMINPNASEATVVCAVTVIEGPAYLIRQAQAAALEKGDAGAALAALRGYVRPGAKVRVVGDCVAESASGKQARAEAVCESALPRPPKLDAASSVREVPWETRQAGLRLEVETTVGADLRTLDSVLNLELHAGPPRVQQTRVTDPASGHAAEFPVAEVKAARFSLQLSVASGATRLIGIAMPASAGDAAGEEDNLWAAFATFTTRMPRKGAHTLEPAEITPPANDPPPPPGMVTVLLHVPHSLVDPWRENAQTDKTMPSIQAWLAAQGVAFPPGAALTHEHDVLRVTNTPANIGRVVAQLEAVLSRASRTAAFAVHTFQAPAAFLRDLVRRTTTTADDAAMLAAVEEAVARGEAACIDSLVVETTPGGTGLHEAGYQHSYLEKFSSEAKGRPVLKLGRRQVGSFFSAAVTRQDYGSATFEYRHELHTAPPAVRRMRFQDPATQKPFELPVTDFHVARAQGTLHLASGEARLLALHAPVGRAEGEAALLCATFLRMDAATQTSRFTHEAMAEAERKRDREAGKLRADPHAWDTRSFRVPPDFTAVSGPAEPAGGGGLAEHDRVMVKNIFTAAGVEFPEGAAISYNRGTSTVFLKNTRGNLARAEAFLNEIQSFQPATLVFAAQVLEGPAPLLRRLAAQTAGKNDHRAELDALLAAVKQGSVRHAGTLHLEGKSGTPSMSGDASGQPYLASVTTDDQGAPVFEQAVHQGGFCLEAEPTIDADGYVANITLVAGHASATPVQHGEKIIDTHGRTLEFPLTDHFRARTTTSTCIITPASFTCGGPLGSRGLRKKMCCRSCSSPATSCAAAARNDECKRPAPAQRTTRRERPPARKFAGGNEWEK